MESSLVDLLGLESELHSESRNTGHETSSLTSEYLSHLSTLSLSSVESEENQKLAQSSHSVLLALQALSTRSYKSVIQSSEALSTLGATLSSVDKDTKQLQETLPKLEEAGQRFSQAYSKSTDNALLHRRRRAMLLARNADRLSDILDLPSLLSTAVSSSTSVSSGAGSTASASGTSGYASALDLYAHIKRIHHLYPNSGVISSVAIQAEAAMQQLTTNIITHLRSPNLKLAGAMRMIGWLRRLAPELDDKPSGGRPGAPEGGYGALFLVCRLANLNSLLDALQPLRELADQEGDANEAKDDSEKSRSRTNDSLWSSGQHTERYLKRYLEIFREQSFAILSMYRSIFPASSSDGLQSAMADKPATTSANTTSMESQTPERDPLQPILSPLSSFSLHLVELLMTTLRAYLPQVRDRSARDSLLTQVLYCAGSLGRLGGDFSLLLASLDSGGEGGEGQEKGEQQHGPYTELVLKHRALAGRLDVLASGLAGRAR
ncbi:MAG: hypothetical protein M1823_004709 [Watsoniomyces obsoletus]|nr:MAG: hypothetical protein M1823_004709 [Watsoniomyces obsoletus]